MSRVGLKPITLPAKVAVKVASNQVSIEGPKGTLQLPLPDGIAVENNSEAESPFPARPSRAFTRRFTALSAA